MNPIKRTCSTLQLDAAARAIGQGALRALSPGDRRSAIAGVAGFVLRLFRRQDALEPSSNRPRTVPGGSDLRPPPVAPRPRPAADVCPTAALPPSNVQR
jgi:hypothetical protein